MFITYQVSIELVTELRNLVSHQSATTAISRTRSTAPPPASR